MNEKHLTWSEIHLDALRGIAAMIVALGHARGLFFPSITGAVAVLGAAAVGSAPAPEVEGLTMGHEAVMIFFVLSGYLVGGSVIKSIAADDWSWTRYGVKRLVRLWIVLIPAIWIGLMIDDAGKSLFGSAGSIYTFPSGQGYVTPDKFTEGHSLSTIIGNVFFLQTIFVPPLGTNLALWSLSNEFWYYLAFPLFLLAFRRKFAAPRRLAYCSLAIGILFLIGGHASYLFLVWAMGAAIATLKPVIPANKAGPAVFAMAILSLFLIVFAKQLMLPLPLAELLIGATTAVLIYAIKCQPGASKFTLYNKSAKFCSDISYTLYLTHLPFLVLLCAIVNSPWRVWPLSVVMGFKFCLVIATTILWATLMHRLFEAQTDQARNFVMRQLAKVRPAVAATRR